MEIMLEILDGVGQGLVKFAPQIAQSLWDVFCTLFLTFTELEGVKTVTGLNFLGWFSVGTIVIGISYKVVPIALNFLTRKIKRKRV